VEFLLKKKEFEKAAEKLVNVIPKKNIKPIPSGVKIFEEEGVLFFEATDMESSVKIKMGAYDLKGGGTYVVDAITLHDIAKNLLNDEVTFELESNRATAHTGTGEVNIPIMNADDFPELDFSESGEQIGINREKILNMIEKVIFCASKDEMVRNLNGVFWEFSGKYLRLVSADSFRLALAEEQLFDDDAHDSIMFLIALKSMKEIQTFLKNSDEELFTISYDGKKIRLELGNIIFASRIVESSFPDYKAVVPDSFKTRLVIKKGELLKSLRLINIITKEVGDTVKLDITDERFLLTARSPDRGDAEIPLSVKKEGQDLKIAFDPAFLIEGIQHFDNEDLELNFVDENSALQINDLDLQGFVHIIMPVKLRT